MQRKAVPLCSCKAHTCDDEQFYHNLSSLFLTHPPLTDDTGNQLASVLLSHVLKAAQLPRLNVCGPRAGTHGTVKYILRVPSGVEYLYSGWPDFQICHTFSKEEQQLRKPIGKGAQEAVCGIGEIQSSPGNSTTAKSRALAQAGIYALGHFRNTTVDRITIVLYKDITAHIALATIRRTKGEQDSQHVLGEVDFKLVHDVSPFNLRDASDLMKFSAVFIATLKSVLV